jgi:hypothetical protein
MSSSARKPARAVSILNNLKFYMNEQMPLVNVSVTLYGISFKVFDLANFKAQNHEKN